MSGPIILKSAFATVPRADVVATADEIDQALAFISTLPHRPAANVRMQVAAYELALQGVGGWGLQEAVTQILQGRAFEIDHGFLPSPPELRRVCDRIEQERKQHFEALDDAARCEGERREAEERLRIEASEVAARRAAAPPAQPHLSPQERTIWPRYRDGGEAAVADIAAKFPGWWLELRPKFDRLMQLEAGQ